MAKQMLLTKALAAKVPALYTTESVQTADKVAVIKFFCPWNAWTWYVIEGEVEPGFDDGDDFRFFGRVDGHESELGYFSLHELQSIRGPFGLRIERDIHFRPTPVGQL